MEKWRKQASAALSECGPPAPALLRPRPLSACLTSIVKDDGAAAAAAAAAEDRFDAAAKEAATGQPQGGYE